MWSLERRLPLFILGLLAIVVLVFALLAYRQVRGSTIERVTQRLENVSAEVLASSARTSSPRLVALRQLADSAPIRAALVDPAAASGARALLAAAARPIDSVLVSWELWTAQGELRFRTGPSTARDSVMLAVERASFAPPDSARRSPLFGDAGRMHTWTVIPVHANGDVAGFLAEHRRLANSARAEQAIRNLIDEDIKVFYSSTAGIEWSTLRGVPTGAPFTLPMVSGKATLVPSPTGASYYVVKSVVPESPYVIVLAQSEASVLRRPLAFLRNLLVIGLLVLGAGTVGAWLLGRHVTRPLRTLGEAADAMAHGDYSYRVRATGGAEMAQLADTFNAMAARIGDTHAVLAHQNAELERAIEARTRFLAMMSHELRTPLNAIGGYADLLALGVRGPVLPEQVEDLGRIRRNKDQLLHIIADILHFSRVDAGYLALRSDDIDLSDAFVRVSDTVRPLFEAKGVTLVVHETMGFVRADSVRLQQVLVNLLTNSCNFTSAGGSVSLAAARDDEWVELTVRDTGIGIPPEQLEAIFEPFVQVDASLTRRVGGAGLGLSIVRELANAMGGTVRVESTVGRGSTFTVTLPASSRVTASGLSGSMSTVG